MITPAETALLEAADPGKLPGINETVGNPAAASSSATASLKSLASITTNAAAPFYYNAALNEVIVHAAGTVLSGYNFGSAEVLAATNNVTINDCTFSTPTDFSVRQYAGYSGLVLENSTFQGGDDVAQPTSVFTEGYATIENNTFLDTPGHDVQIDDGVISGNYFEGGGYSVGVHADAIQICDTVGPVMISGNVIDWTNNANALMATNSAIRIATDNGNTSNVTVTGNALIGGGYTVYAESTKDDYTAAGATGTVGQNGVMSNVNITGNYIGWGAAGAFYPTPAAGVTTSGNTIVDYTNPIYSEAGWTSYLAKGVQTQYLITSAGSNITGNPSGTATLHGDGLPVDLAASGLHETVFVGGAGGQSLIGGPGANVFAYLSVGDSPGIGGEDIINGFDPAKDVIDLSAINSNPGGIAGAASNFTFIGTAAFTAAGDEVRTVYNPSNNITYVEANLAGDASYGEIGSGADKAPDLVIRLAGDVNLTAANFALTPAQSTADQAAAAALSVTMSYFAGGSETAYTNVEGRAYSSYDLIKASSSGVIGEAFNNTNGSGSLTLTGANVVYGSTGTSAYVGQSGGSDAFIAAHSNETIQAGLSGSERFQFGQGFGAATIDGFLNSGGNADTIQLSISAFSYLNAGMTQAQDLAAVISHGSNGTNGFTIQDSSHDTLTLAGFTSTSLAGSNGAFHFV